eukprot:6491470-Amphidinium_carterae.2
MALPELERVQRTGWRYPPRTLGAHPYSEASATDSSLCSKSYSWDEEKHHDQRICIQKRVFLTLCFLSKP